MNIQDITAQAFRGAARDPKVNEMVRNDGTGVGSFPPGYGFKPHVEIETIIKRCCPSGRLDCDRLILEIKGYFESIEKAYAATQGVLAAELDGKPNNAFTFVGNNPALGALYPGGTAVPLFTRANNVLAATAGFLLQPWILIQRIVADPTDAAAGWYVAGGTTIVATDPVPSFQNDYSLTELDPRMSRLDSPVAQLYNRPVSVPALFTMSVIHYNAAPISLKGITIAYQDNRCQESWAQYATMGPAVYRMSFADVVNMFVEQVRSYGGTAAAVELRQAASSWR